MHYSLDHYYRHLDSVIQTLHNENLNDDERKCYEKIKEKLLTIISDIQEAKNV